MPEEPLVCLLSSCTLSAPFGTFRVMHKGSTVMQKAEEDRWPRRVKRGGAEVTIYRVSNRGRALYQAAYWLGGKRWRKSFARYSDAWSHAEQQATLINVGRTSVAEMRDSDREAFVAAKRELASLGVPVLEAVRC
jgi:hypothetical protein